MIDRGTRTAAVLLAALIGCGSPQTAVKAPVLETRPLQEDTTGQDESYKVGSLLDEDWKIEPRQYPYHGRRVKSLETSGDTAASRGELAVLGFRVQILTTTDYHRAMAVRDEALAKFTAEVYLDYEPPNYKVRVGNCINADDAEALRSEAKTLGFADAWIVKTKVIVRKD